MTRFVLRLYKCQGGQLGVDNSKRMDGSNVANTNAPIIESGSKVKWY